MRPAVLALLVGALLALAPAASARPRAEFVFSPAAPVAGASVTFVARDDCDRRVCTWSGEGGVAGTGRVLVHAFQAAGSYRVRVTVAKRERRRDRTRTTRTTTHRTSSSRS